MRRLPRQELLERFVSILRDEPEFKTKRPRELTAVGERAHSVASRLAALIDNGSLMVICADPINDQGAPGRWGTDEPDPTGPPRAAHNMLAARSPRGSM